MKLGDLISATEYMWGNGAKIYETKIEGIYDTSTDRHGGYLVDIRIHPELKNYGAKTNLQFIRAFEEDYEALKVLWLYPELINNQETANKWLNEKSVIRFDKDENFIKEFPTRKELTIHRNLESEELEV